MSNTNGRALGHRIRAVVKTDDGQKSANFCAFNWFHAATDDDIRALHYAKYRGEDADAVAHYANEVDKDKGVAQVDKYLTTYKPRSPRGGIIGFECVVKRWDAWNYLNEHRPNLAAELFPDGEPG